MGMRERRILKSDPHSTFPFPSYSRFSDFTSKALDLGLDSGKGQFPGFFHREKTAFFDPEA